MRTLPPLSELDRIARGLATLDAILSADWETRYYSFNAAWARGVRMASMRNGSGDEWFLVFTKNGAFLKGLAHEYPPGDLDEIYDGLPATLRAFRKEPAFTMEDTSYGGWFTQTWTIRSAPKLAKIVREHLEILHGEPEVYRAYAAEYFEADVPLDAIRHVYAGKKLDQGLITRINPERRLAGLKSDLAEIGYAKSK